MAEWVRHGETRDRLGESPIWSVAEQALYWVDIRGKVIRRRALDGKVDEWPMPELVGCIALREDGRGLIVAMQSSVALFETSTGRLTSFLSPHADQPNMRFNDGRCDRQGRFWVGSMDDVGRGPVGVLYRFEDGTFHPVLEGISIPNSLCWSPDGSTMYFADGALRTVWAFDFDTETGSVSGQRVFVRLRDGDGNPDGAVVDSEGYVWLTHYKGGKISRHAPDGIVELELRAPVLQTTSCCIGGAELKTLFVTTATQSLSMEELPAQPLVGSLLAIDIEVSGLPEAKFREGAASMRRQAGAHAQTR